MDPYAVLGLPPGASPEEVTAAWKRLAKRWHPDRAGDGARAAARMAEINAAYDAVRLGVAAPPGGGPALRREPDAPSPHEAHGIHVLRRRRTGRPGAWLDEATRVALGRELLLALERDEAVHLVTRAATWASPEANLAVTDRRLLWLHDDAISHRVRALRYRSVRAVEDRLAWPRRRTATVRVVTKEGRRVTFSELPPATAASVARHVRAGLGPRR